jgi:hypothetical protein
MGKHQRFFAGVTGAVLTDIRHHTAVADLHALEK